jgi:ribonuclease P protein component
LNEPKNILKSANSFPPEVRIRTTREYDRVFAEGKSAADALLVVYTAPNGLPFARLGVIAGRRFGKAVQRNRAKRLTREAFRTSRDELPGGCDFVVIARKGLHGARFEEVKSSLIHLANKAGRR